MANCPHCIPLDCSNPSDTEQYSLQSGLIFTNGALGFVVNCPAGYVCADGYYPITITIPVGTIKLPIPPTTFPTFQEIVLILNCCQSSVSRTVPVGSTQAQLTAIALELINECAAQQAECDVITNPPAPGVPPPMPVNPPDNPTANVRVDMRSTPQTASKVCGAGMTGSISVTAPAGTFGTVLWNPTAATIATTQAYLDSLALAQAQAQVDAITPPSITNSSPLPAVTIGVPYSEQLNGTGGTAPYTFAIVSGALPSGLTLSATGLISGTPTTDVAASFTVSITDANGRSCSKAFEMGVAQVCPEFKENITDGTMNLTGTAAAAEDISKVLVLGQDGGIQIIESVGNVDTVVATGSVSAFNSVQYAVYVPTTGKFFVNTKVGISDNPIARINPDDATTEATGLGSESGAGSMSYNATTDRIIMMGDTGGGWAIISINPATLGATTVFVATTANPAAAIFCAAGNRVFIGIEPSSTEVRFLNGSTYSSVATFDIFLEHGGAVTNLTQFPDAGVECNGKFFYGCAFKTGVPRTSVELAVFDPVALTFLGFVDLTSETLNDIQWIEADEDFGIILVKAGDKMIVVDADTLDIVCSFTTSSTCFQFAVQPANNRVFVPNIASDNVAVYTHTP